MTRFDIRSRRKARGMSQLELAQRVGVSKVAVSLWESGENIPAADKLPTIAAVLECEIEDLYDGETLRLASEAAERRVREKAAADARALAGIK